MPTRTTSLTHERLWSAIDAIAAHNGLSPSALARRAGLSSTAFNKSKRTTSDGRPRWPSTESIAKILEATGADLDDLVRLVTGPPGEEGRPAWPVVPFLEAERTAATGFAEAAAGPAGAGATMAFPGSAEALFAFEIDEAAASPPYRSGDVLVASTAAPVRRGDRVLVRTRDGRIAVRLFLTRNGRSTEFAAPSGRRGRLRLPSADVIWMARILWASQ
jgi:phage repressor protein C with HTH and peptisase S24 domain